MNTEVETEIPSTEEVIAGMLTENTGSHFLDSGGAYGRNWERNQGNTVETYAARPAAVLDTSWGGINVTLDVYHFLVDRLQYEHELQVRFERFAGKPEYERDGWLTIMEDFPSHLAQSAGAEVAGIYGDGQPFTVNTYNHESLLGQTLQYTFFSLEGCEDIADGTYILLQVHGGCDVRGGYTAPKVFSLSDYDGTAILDDSKAEIVCIGGTAGQVDGQLDFDGKPVNNHCGAHWYTDDGYHWYPEGCCSSSTRDKQLENVEWVEAESLDDRQKGQITVVEGVAYCPECGEGKLEAWPIPGG